MKITLWANASGFAEVDVDDAGWDGMSEIERHEHMLSELLNCGIVQWGWDVNPETDLIRQRRECRSYPSPDAAAVMDLARAVAKLRKPD